MVTCGHYACRAPSAGGKGGLAMKGRRAAIKADHAAPPNEKMFVICPFYGTVYRHQGGRGLEPTTSHT